MKLIEEKAGLNDMNKEFAIFEEKMKSLQGFINQMMKEFEKIEDFYNEFSSKINTNQAETITTFIGNNKITKARCVCCGNKGKNKNYNIYENNHVKLILIIFLIEIIFRFKDQMERFIGQI